MIENTKTAQATTTAPTPVAKRPNDTGTVSVQGFVKIFDPVTKQVFVENRA